MNSNRLGLTTLTLALIPVAIAINLAVGQLVLALGIPIYGDSIGTVLAGVLAGPWAGALTGFLTNIVRALSGLNPNAAPFAIVAAVIGLLAGFFAGRGWLRAWWQVLLAGIVTGLVAAIISAPIAAYLFGGVMGSGTDALVAFFRKMGFGVLRSSLGQGVVSDPVDKAVAFVLVWLIVRALPGRFLARFPRADKVAR